MYRRSVLVAGASVLLCCVPLSVIGLFVDTGGGETEAKVTAQTFVERQLKSPSTAEFPPTYEFTATKTEKEVWKIGSYVDAQNSFGAKLCKNWVVTLRYDGKSKWTMLSCVID